MKNIKLAPTPPARETGAPAAKPIPTVQELAATAAQLLADAKSLRERILAHRDDLTAAKGPQLHQTWLTVMGGCLGTAINHSNLHVQGLNAVVEAQKNPAPTPKA